MSKTAYTTDVAACQPVAETLTSRIVDRSNYFREQSRLLSEDIDGLSKGIIEALNVLFGPDYAAQVIKSVQGDQGPTEAPQELRSHSLIDASFSAMDVAQQQLRYRRDDAANAQRLLYALTSGINNGVNV